MDSNFANPALSTLKMLSGKKVATINIFIIIYTYITSSVQVGIAQLA